MKPRHSALALVVCACALIGCVAPKATEADPATKEAPKTEPAKTEPQNPSVDDGLRVGNLMELPKDTETRATKPGPAAPPAGNSAVIVTPPVAPAPKPTPPQGP